MLDFAVIKSEVVVVSICSDFLPQGRSLSSEPFKLGASEVVDSVGGVVKLAVK